MIDLLYNFGEYEDIDLIKFTVPNKTVKDIIKIFKDKDLLATGNIISQKSISIIPYIKSFLKKEYKNPTKHYNDEWIKNKKEYKDRISNLEFVSGTGVVFTEDWEWMTKEQYIKDRCKKHKQIIKNNKFINKLLKELI